MQDELAMMLEWLKVWTLMSDSSTLRNVWSPLAPIHVALRPCLAPDEDNNSNTVQGANHLKIQQNELNKTLLFIYHDDDAFN